jgi:5-methyltetrahydrofolate--homocysteine methyltransferase
MSDLSRLSDAVAGGDRDTARAEVQGAIDAGVGAEAILDAMVAGMHDIGERFRRREAFVPEMLIAARAMKSAMPLLEPLLVEAGLEPERTVVIGTVEGDLHDIGKNLVALMWRGANVRVVDLGVNVPAERFVEAVREHDAGIVGLSSLLTTTMPSMEKTIQVLRAGAPAVKVLVGGAPLSADWAAEIGADGYAPDAGAAVDVLRGVIEV